MSRTIIGLSAALTLLCFAATFAPAASSRELSMQSATGAGNFFTTSGFLREFAFTVREYGDGSVQGEAQMRARSRSAAADTPRPSASSKQRRRPRSRCSGRT